MIFLLYTIHIVICLFLILVVLLQQGKGADLSVFGGGGTMTAFGARGAATLLHKMTVVGFVGFIVTTLAIGILQKQGGGSSVMSDQPVPEAAATATADAEEEAEPEEIVGAFAEDEGEADESTPVDGEEPATDDGSGDGETIGEDGEGGATGEAGTDDGDATEGGGSEP